MAYGVQTIRGSGRILGWLALVAAFAALNGCSTFTLGGRSEKPPAQTDVLERSRMQLVKPPQAAAECIAENARAAGVAAQMRPLYGYESVGVIVTSRIAGDHVAVFTLTRSEGGARAETTTYADVPDREALLRRLTQGC
jgi:hypothetical protein